MKNRNIFIGIVGPSGAGKSTVCKILKESGDEYEHIRLDDYFKSPRTFPKKFGFPNWELPSNLKFEKLLSDLKKLADGKIVKTETFSKKKGSKGVPLTLYPKKYILVEGFMLYKNKELRSFLDKKFYFDIPTSLILERRKARFGEDHVSEYDTKIAIPEFLKHGIIQKKYADYVFDARRTQVEIAREIKLLISTVKSI